MQHQIVSRDEWMAARAELLVRQKEHTHASDMLAADRQRLPIIPMEHITVMGSQGLRQKSGKTVRAD